MEPELVAKPPPVGVIDLHVDLSYQSNYEKKTFERGTGQFPASALRRAGVVGVVLPLYVPREVSSTGPRLRDLEWSYAQVFRHLSVVSPYRLPGCPREREWDGVATWLSFEGSHPMADEPQGVQRWVARGVRVFGLVHSYNTKLGASATGGADVGLLGPGRDLVNRVFRWGALPDISHASDRAATEVIELGLQQRLPVIATHSNVRALAPHPRNLSDRLIQGIARTGGIVGINFHSAFLARGRAATLADVIKHIEYVIRLVGDEHVALGSDFEGDIRPPAELSTISDIQKLAQALRSRGHSEVRIRRIFANNARRLLCRPPRPKSVSSG